MWKFLLVALLAALCLVAEAGRRNGNRRGGGAQRGRGRGVPPNAQDVSMWNRTLVTSQAKEVGYTLPDNADQIYIMSANKRQLKKDGYKPSKMLYDFTGSRSKAVLKVKRNCFLLDKPEVLTRADVLQIITNYNGQTREATTPVQMYVTDLSPEQLSDLQGRTAVTALCGSKPMKALTTEAPTGSTEAFKTLLVTSLDEQISLNLPPRRKQPRGRKQKGGRRRQAGRRGNPENSQK